MMRFFFVLTFDEPIKTTVSEHLVSQSQHAQLDASGVDVLTAGQHYLFGAPHGVSTLRGGLRADDEFIHFSNAGMDLLPKIKVICFDRGRQIPGLRGPITMDAYGYPIDESLEGKLEYRRTNTQYAQEPNRQSISTDKARISAKAKQANHKLNLHEFNLAMTASVDIHADSRSGLM